MNEPLYSHYFIPGGGGGGTGITVANQLSIRHGLIVPPHLFEND